MFAVCTQAFLSIDSHRCFLCSYTTTSSTLLRWQHSTLAFLLRSMLFSCPLMVPRAHVWHCHRNWWQMLSLPCNKNTIYCSLDVVLCNRCMIDACTDRMWPISTESSKWCTGYLPMAAPHPTANTGAIGERLSTLWRGRLQIDLYDLDLCVCGMCGGKVFSSGCVVLGGWWFLGIENTLKLVIHGNHIICSTGCVLFEETYRLAVRIW